MILMYSLTMSNRESWNGKWSGEEEGHYIFKTVRAKCDIKRAEELNGKTFWHNFGDGWTACIDCRIIDSKQKQYYAKKNGGFCGYDWMCNSIWHGWVDTNWDKIYHEKPIEIRLKDNAKMERGGNDLFFSLCFLAATDKSPFEAFHLRWTGYNDSNWWDNVATDVNVQTKKFKGEYGTEKTFRIDFKTRAVYEAL